MDGGRAKEVFLASCDEKNLKLPLSYFSVLFEVAGWVASELTSGRKVIGLSGAQGSGKSTFASLLKTVLSVTGVRSEVLSLDDFYLTKQKRRELVATSPLLETRGVPGTHDLAGCLAALSAFRNKERIDIPEFSKAEDDQVGARSIDFADVDLLIFEGWCWGCRPQNDAELLEPVNELEVREDGNLNWRRYVNQQIERYQPLFSAELNVLLRVPDFSAVRRWRWQQEQMASGPMTEAQVGEFIMYFQRITESLLNDPKGFDVVVQLDQSHDLELRQTPDF